MYTAGLPSGLDGLTLPIEKLMRIGGTPGLVLAVMEGGVPVYQANFGHSDVETQVPISREIIFPACSLAKAITATAVGILVDEGKFGWDTLVKVVIPSFHPKDETFQTSLTVTNLLSHRSGMAWAGNLAIGTENNVLIAGKDNMFYNNLPYDLAGTITEGLSDQSYFDFPAPEGTSNDTACYNALEDGTTAKIPCPKEGRGRFLYKAFGHNVNDQLATGATSTPGSPFKQVAHITSSKTLMDQPSKNGLFDVPSQLVLLPPGQSSRCSFDRYHMLLPDSDKVILVLSNSLALTGVPDWFASSCWRRFLRYQTSERIDVIKPAAETSIVENLKWYPTLVKELVPVFEIAVTLEDGNLYWALQGLGLEKYKLTHYEDGSFTWLLTRNELSRRGRWLYWAHDAGVPPLELTKE
ncbi:beta-lactamase/transpeptidase-like protein [Apiosordaria backusii]|uniref:Beta-lactamase/transpeptidase-like protein n=1 Tax=Apiosordaria backusii TaxID=314023 RepID=A0AA40B2B4_9PEZI|nr:beta-lactamase/transpeptidase-like protein [Apiosordaria backusii]